MGLARMNGAARTRHPVVPYDPTERGALREFQRCYFGPESRQCNDQFSDWLFERNPHRDSDKPVFWLCKRDGIVVGQQASIPVRLKVGETECRAAWGIDLMVHDAWRLRGVGPALSATYESSADVLMGLGMSSAAVRSYSRAGWADMGRLPFAVRPLDVAACADGLGRPAWLKRLAPQLIVGGSARLVAGVAGLLSRCSLEPIRAFDERVDGAWAQAAGDYRTLVKRDFKSVRWRYDLFPEPLRYERFYLMRGSRVLGYSVVRMDRWRGHPIARVVDYLVPRARLRPLFAMLIDAMREAGAVAVLVEQLHDGATAVLRSLGCVRADGVTQFMLKAQPDRGVTMNLLTETCSWMVTRGDSDSDFGTVAAGEALPQTAGPVSGLRVPGSSNA